MITRDEAGLIAEKWVADSAPPDVRLIPMVHEFDLGYVVWGGHPPGTPPLVGAGRGIIDKETGDLSVWPSLPVELVIGQFRERRTDQPRAPRTSDPADQVRRDLRRLATPAKVTHLTLADRVLVVRSVKGDAEPQHHRLVREFYAGGMGPEYRERGYDRCSEAAAFSDALHAEDARRTVADAPAITVKQAREELFAGARMSTYLVREGGDAVAGQVALPCFSCVLLGRSFGFELNPPRSPSLSEVPLSAEAAEMLGAPGWSRVRGTDEQTARTVRLICDQVGRHGARIESFEAANAVLTAFGGMSVAQHGPGRDLRRRPFTLDPLLAAATAETLADFGGLLGTRLFPLGMEGDHDAMLAIDESGRIFALDHAGEWFLGDSIEPALAVLMSGTQPLRIDDHGHW
ncbi:SUKH-3 domain-containing protein [Tenggerimyces flavus]|uniref:SUKH-3 domain-containing protein n=1 Tax=Tenggerimyces flavus TaxID=1708749 RepID=A0ABV7YM44_9ACTN|nr:SUKH-3 domain-containing protein [Tenggerimyces flavus]MBM7790147.1 hypothetical protein [Tenggerimyces flavus]